MKKTFAILLLALLAFNFAACTKTTETKSANQITIFAAAPLEAALTEIAQQYTDAAKNPDAKKDSVILFDCGETEALAAKLDGNAYCDALIAESSLTLDAADVARANVLMISGTSADGAAVSYSASILSVSDRQEAAQAFLDYLRGDGAKAIFEKYGFTVA